MSSAASSRLLVCLGLTALLALGTATSAAAASAAAVSAATTAVAPAAAASDSGDVAWSMMPVITDVGEERSNFAYRAEPGTVIEDAVLVRNSGASALELAVYGSDAFTDQAGALDIVTADAAPADVGEWITTDEPSVRVEVGEVIRIPFTVTVPDDAQPGEHVGALLTARESAGDTLSVDMRYATRVAVTVAGELTAGLALEGAQAEVDTGFWPWESAAARVSYAVHNTGNTRLSAMQLITAPGVELYATPASADGLQPLTEMLPGAAVDVDATVDGIAAWWPVVDVEISVSPTVLLTGADDPPSADQQQTVVSTVAVAPGWWVLLSGIVLAALIVVLLVRRARGRARTAPDS